MPQMIESTRPRRRRVRLAAPRWAAVTGRLLLAMLIAASSLLTPLLALPAGAGEAQEALSAARALAPAGTGDVPLEGFLDVGSCTVPNYGVAAAGDGLFQSVTSGTLNLTLPAGSTPAGAYVFWNGADSNGNGEGDPQVGWTDPLLGNSALTPAQGYGGALWEGTPSLPGPGANIHYAWSYRADVTNYSGSGAYGVSDVGVLPGGTFNVYNNGAGMLALYRNPSLGPQRVQLAHGLDLMQGDTLPSSGPGGEPLAFDFAPESSARTAQLISLVGGILNPATQPHQLWYLTGSGAKPTGDIYGLPGAQVINNPFTASDGIRWDTYQTSATIPANASWIIIQLRSLPTQGGPDSTAPRLEWIAQSFALPLDCPDLGDQTFVDWNNNGVYDPGVDQPFPNNMIVSLTGPSGYTDSTTATGGQANGNYLFPDLPAPDAPLTGAFTASVPPQTGYTNTTPLSQTRNLTYPGPDALDVDFGFLPNSGIQVVKTVSLNGICPGQDPVLITGPTQVTYCFAVTNTGGTTLTNVTVNDNVLVPSLICTIPILAPGASQTCTRVVTVSQSTTNVATATGVPSQPNGTPIPDGVTPVTPPRGTDDATVNFQQPGLNIDKRLTSPASGNTTTGNTVVFDIVLTNSGSTVLNTVSLTDDWSDACLALQGVSPDPGAPDTGSCLGGGACSVGWNNVGPLNPGQSKTFTFTFLARYNPIPTIPPTLPDCSPTINTATSDGVDANGTPVGPVSDNAPVNIYQPSVEVVKTVSLNGVCPGQDPVTVTPGTTVTYCYVVTNTGDTHLSNISVTDDKLGTICPPPAVPTLAPGASHTCTKTATINQTTTNVGTVTGTPSNPDGTPIPGIPPVTDTDTGTVNTVTPGITVVKTVSLTGQCPGQTAATVTSGTTVTYCYVVTNTGNTNLTDISVTDDKLGVVCPPPAVPTLAPGASHTCTKTATITQTTTNVATATGTPPGLPPVTSPPSPPVTVTVVRPSIQVVKTVSLDGQCPGVDSTTVPAGTSVTYCYQVTNTGDTTLAPVTVTDNVVGAVCSIASLAPGASQTCTKAATVTADTTNVGTATGTPVGDTGAPIPGVGPVSDTDTATVDVVRPGITVDKTVRIGGVCPGQDSITAPAGTTVTYCYVVTNTGDTYLANITVTDVPLGAICTIPLLAPGASQTCTKTATVTQNTTNVGTATGQPSDPQGNPLPNVPPVTDEDTATVTVSTTGIQVDKTVSLTGQCPGQNSVQVVSGTTVTYCYVVTNTGANYLSNIQVTDNLLGAICTIPLLAPGASQTCTKTALILTDTTNVGTATGQPSDPNGTPIPGAPPVTDQDDAIVDVVAPQVVIDKTVSLDGNCPGQNSVAVAPGTTVTYCYRVTNSGDTYLSNIQVTDNLLGAICTIPLLAPGASQNCTKTATITADTTNVGTATGTPSTPDGTPLPGVPPVTDTDEGVVDVVRPAVVLDKTVSLNGQCPGQNSVTVAPGTTVTYCYQVTNTGDTYVANIQVTDNVLGAICTIPLLAPGASQTCTRTATITQNTTNVGTATGQPSNPNGEPLPGIPPVTDTDDATVTTAQAGIQVVKTVGRGQCPGQNSVVVVVGTTVTYCYVVTNTGATYLANIQVTDNVLGLICTIPLLAPGASQTCTKTAIINQDVTNVGTASGTPSDGQGNPLPGVPPVNDTDDATVDAINPSLVIDKTVSTTGACPGQNSVTVPAGTTVTYCYLVTNTGDTRLANVTVTDDKLGAVCTIPSLLPGQSQNCTKTAIITQAVTNIGTATGTPVDNQGNPFPSIPPVSDVSDTDSAAVSTGEPTGAIGDLVWRDLNVDGYPNAGEPGIAGVQVCLHQDVNGNGVLDPADVAAVLECQVTNANGGYLFVGVPAGAYFVNVTAANFQPGGPLEDLHLTSRFTLGPNPLPVSLAAGQIFLNADLGFARAAMDIQKKVGAGCCCGNEVVTILPGQVVKYCFTVTNTGDTWLDDVVITDDKLGFICQVPIILAPGQSYTCTKEVPVQADVCNIGTGTGNPTDNKGDDLTEFPDVSDQDGACVDVVRPAIDIVKTVTTANGVCPGQDSISVGPGTVVKYCYVVTNTGETHLHAVTVTDDKLGFVCFVPGTLAPGASTTCSALGAINQTTMNTGTASGDPSDATGTPYPNMPDVTDTDTATVDICRAGLGDMVWVDFYITDGIQQPQETLGIPGVPIIVVNSSGQQVATAITGPDGKYAINDLAPGTYTVIVGSAPGYLLTSPGVRTTTLTCGAFDPTMDFGFVDTTAVTLQSLAAQRQGNKTVVSWSTHSEEGNEGFHVWRALRASGPYVRLTSRPLASKAPVNGGATYSYTDSTVQNGQTYWYRIETTPDGELFGPVNDTPQTMRKLFLPMLMRDR